jgi:hypothetical protein
MSKRTTIHRANERRRNKKKIYMADKDRQVRLEKKKCAGLDSFANTHRREKLLDLMPRYIMTIRYRIMICIGCGC